MKNKGFLIATILIFISLLISCNKTKVGYKGAEKRYSEEQLKEEYGEITLMEEKNGGIIAYKIEEGKKVSIGSKKLFLNFIYNNYEKTYIFQRFLSYGEVMPKNKVDINLKEKHMDLNKYYSYMDIKLSPEGKKIIYRAFLEDNYESAQGMMIYDMENSKEITLNSKVIVSGDVYQWLDENNIIYYGIKNDETKEKGIFKYSIDSEKEEKFIDIKDGYILFMHKINNEEILFLKFNGKSYEICRYNIKSKNNKVITDKLEKIYYAVDDNKDVVVMARDKFNTLSLYKIAEKGEFKRMVYDFPKNIKEEGGLAIDEKGNTYFIGYEVNKDLGEVYMIKNEDNSINLIVDKESSYHIYGTERP